VCHQLGGIEALDEAEGAAGLRERRKGDLFHLVAQTAEDVALTDQPQLQRDRAEAPAAAGLRGDAGQVFLREHSVSVHHGAQTFAVDAGLRPQDVPLIEEQTARHAHVAQRQLPAPARLG
jgi:hypothetical protein